MLKKTMINEENLADVIGEQQNIIKQSEGFVGMLSLRRYLPFNLLELSEDEIVNLTNILIDNDFHFDNNPITYELSDEAVDFLENEEKQLDLSKVYIENLIKGVDIQDEVLSTYTNYQDGKVEFTRGDMFGEIIMTNGSLSMGDVPPLKLVLTLQKALLARVYSLKNIELLEEGELEIYQILPTLT